MKKFVNKGQEYFYELCAREVIKLVIFSSKYSEVRSMQNSVS